MTMMSSRKELFHVINEMCNEMKKKLETDFDNTFIRKWDVGWQVIPPAEPDDEDSKDPQFASYGKAAPSRKRAMDEDEIDDGFSYKASAGFKFGIEKMRIETSYEKYKYINILHIHSVVEGKHTQLRTNIFWYDRLRPTYWKMNRLITYARKLRVRNQALDIEKDLAKMIPDRVDNILLGGISAKT